MKTNKRINLCRYVIGWSKSILIALIALSVSNFAAGEEIQSEESCMIPLLSASATRQMRSIVAERTHTFISTLPKIYHSRVSIEGRLTLGGFSLTYFLLNLVTHVRPEDIKAFSAGKSESKPNSQSIVAELIDQGNLWLISPDQFYSEQITTPTSGMTVKFEGCEWNSRLAKRNENPYVCYSFNTVIEKVNASETLPPQYLKDIHYASSLIGAEVQLYIDSPSQNDANSTDEHVLVQELDQLMASFWKRSIDDPKWQRIVGRALEIADQLRSESALSFDGGFPSSLSDRAPQLARMYAFVGRYTDALDVIRRWRLVASCGMDPQMVGPSGWQQLYMISQLAGETAQWQIFIQSMLMSLKERINYDPQIDVAIRTAVAELEGLGIDSAQLALGMLWTPTEYPGLRLPPKLIAGLINSSRDSSQATKRLIASVSDTSLDPGNRWRALLTLAFQGIYWRDAQALPILEQLQDLKGLEPWLSHQRQVVLNWVQGLRDVRD